MKIFAHRGSSGTHPENTHSAFVEAARLPIYGVEFDVQLTKDGHVVIIHDDTIDRTSNEQGAVKDYTLQQLKEFDFGSWFHPSFHNETIITLEELFTIFASTTHRLNIELKPDLFTYETLVEQTIKLITQSNVQDRVILSSFDHEALHYAKQLAPTIEIAALVMEVLVNPVHYLRSIPADALHTFFPAALRPSIQQTLGQGVFVRAFTVNDMEHATTLRKQGVHAIFTDFPEKMMQGLSS